MIVKITLDFYNLIKAIACLISWCLGLYLEVILPSLA